ncbi:uncharacterized membrane protein YbhN (UPF0104 family), partial [Exiguobacterium sp. PvP048]
DRSHVDEACASFIVCIRRYVFCLIVQFSKFVMSFSATLISYQVTNTIVNNFFRYFFRCVTTICGTRSNIPWSFYLYKCFIRKTFKKLLFPFQLKNTHAFPQGILVATNEENSPLPSIKKAESLILISFAGDALSGRARHHESKERLSTT